MAQTPSKTSVTQIQIGDPVSPAVANAPHTNLETNVDNILTHLQEAISGYFEQDSSTTSGRTFGYRAGVVAKNNAINIVSAGTIVIPANDVSYLEVDGDGNVTSNTTEFTTGSIPLFQITTDSSNITDVADRRTPYRSTKAADMPFNSTSEIDSENTQDAVEEVYTKAKGSAVALAVVFGS